MKTTLTQFFSSLERASRPGGLPPNSGSEPSAKPKRNDPGCAGPVPDGCCQRRTTTSHRATSAAAWAGVLFLLLCGSLTVARAQTVISDPNQIVGTIGWNNPPGPVYNFLNSSSPPHGLWFQNSLSAVQVGGGFSSQTFVPDDGPGHLSSTYSITVQAGTAPGIQYDVAPVIRLEDGHEYSFATATSSGVLPEPAPDEVLNFSECAGLIDLQFVDAADNPVTVQGGHFHASLNGSGQAGAFFGSVSSVRLAVRGGNTFSVIIYLDQTSGSDFFTDYFSLTYITTNYPVTVGCDEIVTVRYIVPTSPIGSGGSVGQIIGNVDMLGESEQWIDKTVSYYGTRTRMVAEDGPQSNYRWDVVTPAFSGGPSSGAFNLKNLLPSNFSTPPRDYRVHGRLAFGSNRRFESFQTPYLDGGNGRVSVPAGTTVDLGNTFVIDPGYVVGDIFFCGPDEGANPNSLLRSLWRGDYDSNGDGFPDSFQDANGYGTWVSAGGLPWLGAGATKSAFGGAAAALFEGDFVSSGPNKNHWVGDYRLALGGLLQETTRWDPGYMALLFNNTTTPADRDSWIYSWLAISDRSFTADVEVVPRQTITWNHRYGFSQVTIRFRATSGALFSPIIAGGGHFNSGVDGPNFEGDSAEYTVYNLIGYGTPPSLATATSDGQVELCLPEGRYTFNPTVYSVNPDGISYSFNTLPPLNVTVGACESLELTPGLVLNVNTIPECVAQSELTLSGSVSSGLGQQHRRCRQHHLHAQRHHRPRLQQLRRQSVL